MTAADDEHYLKRELYERLQRDPSIFEFLEAGSLDGLWYWDVEDPDEEWMSARFKALFGYEDHEVPNTSRWWMENIHPDDLPLALENFRRHAEDPAHPYDQVVRYFHKDGSTVWVRCRGIAIRDDDGRAVRMLGCHNDVTQQMEAQEATSRRNAALARALRVSRQANDELQRFASSVAHDLKSPMTTAKGFARLLEQQADDPRIREFSQHISNAMARGVKMVDDLLEFATTVGEVTVAEPLPLREQVAWALDALDGRLEEVGATTEVQDDMPTVHASAAGLRQVLLNVIDNARKYRDPARPLRLVLRAEEIGDMVQLRISDNGQGIPEPLRDAVFTLGSRVPDNSSEEGGSGVGLATCRAVLSRLGGEIWIEDGKDGVGTTVAMSLPAPPADAGPRMPTVMVVDDDPDALALAEVVITGSGAELVATATSAAEAVEVYTGLRQPPRLALVDLNLETGTAGLDLISALREQNPLQRIVLRTAHMTDEDKAEAEHRGAVACVVKSSIEDLRGVITTYALR